MSDLPNGWTTVALGDVVDISIGKTPPRSEGRYWGKGHPWLSIADMGYGGRIINTKEQITQAALSGQSGRLVKPGTTVMSFKLSIGKVGIVEVPMYTNEAIAALAPKAPKTIHPAWLQHALLAMDLTNSSNRAAMGGTLNKKSLAALRITLPPLNEQRRIAAILGKAATLTTQINQAHEYAEGSYSLVFRQMFGDPIWNPCDFDVRPLKDLVSITSGGTPSKGNHKYWNGGVPWFSAKDFRGTQLTQSVNTVSPLALDETSLKNIPSETPVLVVRGMILARYVPIAQLGVPATINQDVKALLPKGHPNTVNLRFLTENLRALHPHLMSLVTRAAHGTTRLETRHLENLPILRPGPKAEREFARRVKHAEGHTSLRKTELHHIRALSRSLQSRAFRGEL